jgi:UPF0716 protein FxsA
VAILALLFIVVPIAELAIIIKVGSYLGVWLTIGLLIAISVGGAWLVKWQGIFTLRRIQTELTAGRLPTRQLVDGALIILAGALMLTPGFLTDIAGILLLMPPTRIAVRSALMRRFRGRVQTYVPGGMASRRPADPGASGTTGDVIDV